MGPIAWIFSKLESTLRATRSHTRCAWHRDVHRIKLAASYLRPAGSSPCRCPPPVANWKSRCPSFAGCVEKVDFFGFFGASRVAAVSVRRCRCVPVCEPSAGGWDGKAERRFRAQMNLLQRDVITHLHRDRPAAGACWAPAKGVGHRSRVTNPTSRFLVFLWLFINWQFITSLVFCCFLCVRQKIPQRNWHFTCSMCQRLKQEDNINIISFPFYNLTGSFKCLGGGIALKIGKHTPIYTPTVCVSRHLQMNGGGGLELGPKDWLKASANVWGVPWLDTDMKTDIKPRQCVSFWYSLLIGCHLYHSAYTEKNWKHN